MSSEPHFRLTDPSGLRAGSGDWEVLVAVEHAAGVAGVCRDPAGGDHRLCGALGEGTGPSIDEGEMASLELEGLTVAGGLLWPGATRMLARQRSGAWTETAVADGAWLVVTDGQPLAFRAEDDDGGVVRVPPRPGATVVEPVADATDACVACDSTAWDLVTWPASPVPRPHHDEDDASEGGAAAVCRACGHVVSADGYYASLGYVDDLPDGDPAGDEPPVLTEAERVSWAMLPFVDARFPVYGLAEWTGDRRWHGHGARWRGEGDDEAPETTLVRLGHGKPDADPGRAVVVESRFEEAGEVPHRHLREAMEELAAQKLAQRSDRSAPAIAVRREREALMAGVAADLAVVEEIELEVDGVPHPFLMGRCAGGWAAYGVLEPGHDRADRCALTVTVTGADQAFVPFALAEVEDVAPYLRAGA